MYFDFIELGTATMILFAVLNIIGSIPIILKIKQSSGTIEAEKASIVALLIMVGFLFIGEQILGLIGISVFDFAVAGSFILFFLALEMILGIKLFKEDKDAGKTASIVPLAFPIIAGAGSMTSLIALRAEFSTLNILIAILINMTLVYLVLKSTSRIERFLGKGGIAVLQKVFGIILLSIAVKLFSSNAKEIF
jgi:multiple antibiotic resistance protein